MSSFNHLYYLFPERVCFLCLPFRGMNMNGEVIQIEQMQKGDKLTEQKIAQFKEAFQLFDKDNDNYVNITELHLLVRSLNQTPTEAELAQWTKIVDREGKGKFQFPDFLALMANEYKEPQAEDELIEAMQSIFKPKGSTITVKEFKNVMTNLGEKLNDDELNELFKELKMEKEDSFNYEEFIKTILTR